MKKWKRINKTDKKHIISGIKIPLMQRIGSKVVVYPTERFFVSEGTLVEHLSTYDVPLDD